MGKPLRSAPVNYRQTREDHQRFFGDSFKPITKLASITATDGSTLEQNEDLLERLFEDPRANRVAKEIAARTVAALAEPAVLDPLISLLLDTIISQPLADITTNKTPGDYSCRPAVTKNFHNLADYGVFEDLFSVPTGAMTQTSDGPQIEFFLDLAAAHCRATILDVLKKETRYSLNHASDKLRSYLQIVEQHGALDEFAETIFRDLAIVDTYDELNLIEELEAQSIETLLLAKRPEQAGRLAKDRAIAARAAPGTRKLRLKINRIVTDLLRSLANSPAGFVLTEARLLNNIILNIKSEDDLEETDELGWLGLLRLLVKDDRLLALLSKRERRLFERNATHWIHQVEQGNQYAEHPLVSLYDRLNQWVEIGNLRFSVRISQQNKASIFNADNWPFFLAYALGPGDPELDGRFEIIVTRIQTKLRAAGTEIHETSAGMLIDRNGELYLTAEEFSRGHGAGLGPLNNGAIVHLEDAEKLILLRGVKTLEAEG